MAIDKSKIEKWFGNGAVPGTGVAQGPEVHEVRLCAKRLAEAIVDNTPASADQSTAVRHVRQALQWSVEAIVHESQ